MGLICFFKILTEGEKNSPLADLQRGGGGQQLGFCRKVLFTACLHKLLLFYATNSVLNSTP